MNRNQAAQEGLQRGARTRWIAVGDSSRFIIYEKKLGKPLAEVNYFRNESAHGKISDLTQDQPGRSFDSFSKSQGGHQTGTPRHAYGSNQNPKEQAAENLLRDVSAFLDAGGQDHRYENLVLISKGPLLGKLRLLLHKQTQEVVSEEHTKDLAWLSGPSLEKRVESLLALH